MTSFSLEDVTTALQKAQVSPSGVSFEGKSLKLDSKNDAQEVINAINNCTSLQYLNLEGNTLGVDAAEVIAKALEKHPELKHALWKDLFTGRMKTEIPKALEYLGNGLVTAGAKLTELDLSDNAFGPIGVQGLAALLRSASCYALQELRLNNNGLGITGGKLLATALMECYNCSKAQGKPLALRVFIAGRNRLENDGAKAIAQVFKTIGTMEEIAMPQNGIYHVGIAALSEAFTHNKNLRILNLNDNTIGPKGSEAIAKALPCLQKLKVINFGDCLLKTKGGIYLSDALAGGQTELEELIFDHNEIGSTAIESLAKAVGNKIKLKTLMLDGNHFGQAGIASLRKRVQELGRANALGSLSEDESEDSDDEEEGEGDDTEESEEGCPSDDDVELLPTPISKISASATVTVAEFINVPSIENFLALGNNRRDLVIKETQAYTPDAYLENTVVLTMKISSLCINNQNEIAKSALECSEALYKELFEWAGKTTQYSQLNNALLVHLGLIKSEDKKYKPNWNIEGCLSALKNAIKQNNLPKEIKDTLSAFMAKSTELNDSCKSIMKSIEESLLH